MNTMHEETDFRCGTIALAGRPNVGKSTLLNALVGQKVSITSRKSQTTRSQITGIRTLDRVQYIFIDTPGFQTRYTGSLNRTMNRTVKATVDSVDVVLFIVEANRFGAEDEKVLSLIPADTKTLLIANKLDCIKDKAKLPEFLQQMAALRHFCEIVPLSAKRPDHVQALLKLVGSHLPQAEPVYDEDTLTEHNERFLATEIIREKIFRFTGDELPYTSTVIIDKFEEHGRLRRIFATILIDRPSHKAIVIGAKGAKLKEISTQARLDMEQLFDGPVYLEVWVKVKKLESQ